MKGIFCSVNSFSPRTAFMLQNVIKLFKKQLSKRFLAGPIGLKIKKDLFDSCFLKNLKTFVNKYCSELSGPSGCYKIWKSLKISIRFKFTSFYRKSVISRYSIKYTDFKINLFPGLLTLFQCLFS